MFVQGAFHWSVSVIGFCVFFVIGCVAIPHVFPPVKVCCCPFLFVWQIMLLGLVSHNLSQPISLRTVFVPAFT